VVRHGGTFLNSVSLPERVRNAAVPADPTKCSTDCRCASANGQA
jgi:hypothetical protein